MAYCVLVLCSYGPSQLATLLEMGTSLSLLEVGTAKGDMDAQCASWVDTDKEFGCHDGTCYVGCVTDELVAVFD